MRGEARDGHEFVSVALENGAVLSIVTKSVSGNHIIVADVLDAVAKFAKFFRVELKAVKVVAITGSQGKTTTKDMLNSIWCMTEVLNLGWRPRDVLNLF